MNIVEENTDDRRIQTYFVNDKKKYLRRLEILFILIILNNQ